MVAKIKPYNREAPIFLAIYIYNIYIYIYISNRLQDAPPGACQLLGQGAALGGRVLALGR